MRPNRIWQIKIAVGASLMAGLLVVGGRTVAQMRQASEQFDREERRVERKVDALQKDYDDFKLSLERRLVKIETQMEAGVWLATAIAGILLIGVGERVFNLILQRRQDYAKDRGGEAQHDH